VQVSELVARLLELPQDLLVLVRDSEGQLARVDDADVITVQSPGEVEVQRVYITGNY
jgi:hypothetical protein